MQAFVTGFACKYDKSAGDKMYLDSFRMTDERAPSKEELEDDGELKYAEHTLLGVLMQEGSDIYQLVSWQRAEGTTLVRVGDLEPSVSPSRANASRFAVSTMISKECPRSPVNALHDYSSQQKLLEEFKFLGWAANAKITCSRTETRKDHYPSTIPAGIAALDRNSVWLGMVHQYATTYQRLKLARG